MQDRINDVSAKITSGEEVSVLRSLRSKLNANIQSHEQACEKLNLLKDLPHEEQSIVEKEIEVSTELSLDAYEALQTLNEYMEDGNHGVDTKQFDQQREILEIEKLRLENDYKRAELENLKEVAVANEAKKGGTNETDNWQKIKLPEIPLPKFIN